MKTCCYQPYQQNLVLLARNNRKQLTQAESIIWSKLLRNRQLAGYKFLRQKPIDGYIVDFYCSALALVIEIDGDSHVDKLEYDAERTRILNAHGLHVIRYTNNEVISNLQGIYENLVEHIQTLQVDHKPLP